MPDLGVGQSTIDYSDDPGDVTTKSARFGYDSAGRLIAYRETLADGHVIMTMSRSLDAAGRTRTQDESIAYLPPRDRHAEWTYDTAGRVATHSFNTSTPDSVMSRFAYDADGREARYDTFTGVRWKTTFTWDGDRVARVERRDLPTNATIQRWSFTYGCNPGGRSP